MATEHELRFGLGFGPFRLDTAGERLWQGTQELRLRPKSFAVLRYLVERPAQLVTREELLQRLWPGIVVDDGALTTCLREIRQALRDDPRRPQFIETAPRRGYRFIAPVHRGGPAISGEEETAGRGPPAGGPPVALVGRAAEVERLQGWLARALRAERQVGWVTGEPGIGKTTLVEAFLQRLPAGELWVAWGQCVEHYGAGEAYLPVLEALGRLCRSPGGERLLALLQRWAPTWLLHLPGLLSNPEVEALQRRVWGTTPERMVRELADAVVALTAEQPLVLVLEDLHWSDAATVELLAYLARRREPARLLLVGIYRPAEVIVGGHPLKTAKHNLALHGLCEELPLEGLTEAAVGQYLTTRFGGEAWRGPAVQPMAQALHRRTDGNPLFMVAVIETLIQRGLVTEGCWAQAATGAVAVEMPESLHQLIEQQFEGLSPAEQQLLAAASVAGVEFSAAAVAAGAGAAVLEVEEQCARLARQGKFLQPAGIEEWPDGTVAGRFRFRHALHQEVVYARIPVGQHMELHRRIGLRKEAGWGAQAGEWAAELAVHFERSRDEERAVQYRKQAAAIAVQRWAYQEASGHLTRGLELLARLPDTPGRVQHELDLLTALGPALMAAKSQGAPEVGQAYARARELCRQVGETPELFPVLWGLWRFYFMRAEHQTARELAEQCLSLAQRLQAPALLLEAHLALGGTTMYLGEFVPARASLEQGMALYNPHQHRALAFHYGQDPGVTALSYAAYSLWPLGYPDQALQRIHEALTLAQALSHPLSLAAALTYAASIHCWRGEGYAAQERVEAAMALSSEQGFPQFLSLGTIFRGWALAIQGQVEEGIAQIRQGLAARLAMGVELARPWFLGALAEAYGKVDQVQEGLHVLAEALALVDNMGERMREAELHRLKGELLLMVSMDHHAEVEACFQQALAVARRQQAKSFELRAALSLGRLWQAQGRHDEARMLLAEVYGWFTEGFDTADLCEARALLEELGVADPRDRSSPSG